MNKNHPQAMGGGGADGGRGTLINFLRNKVSARRPQAPQGAPAPTAPQGYQPMAGDGRQAMLQAMLMRARGGATPQPAQPAAVPPVAMGTGY